jgi:predicted Ser/Thr protein kinase
MVAAEKQDPLIGTKLGNCEIQRKLGAGGMGAVYLARHVGLDKPVAVKVMAAGLLGSEENVERFKREARTAAKLEHANIVQVYDVSEFPGGHFIVMQYVDGQSVDRILEQKGKLPVEQAVQLVRRIATALAAAHKAGIIHRDIKPANVLISKDGQVKVLDFGLARNVESGQSISSTGQIVGTPHYMAPEQAQGQKVDARTDIYALGATFYHLVTGQRCFDGLTPLSICIKHVQEHPKPPHEVNPDVPTSVSAVIARMMAKDPAARYQSAEELASALGTLSSATARTVVPGGAVAPRKRPVAAAVPIGLALVAAVVIVVWIATRPPAAAVADAGRTSPPPPPPATVEPPPDPPKTAEPPVETGLVRGWDAAFEKLKARTPRDASMAKDLKPRFDEFMRAVERKDEAALREFMPQRTPPKMTEAEWKAARDKMFEEMRARWGTGSLDHVVVLSMDFSFVPLQGARGVLTLEWHVKGSDGSTRISAATDMHWGKDAGQWHTMPPKKRGS